MTTSSCGQHILIVEDQEGPRKALMMILGSLCRVSTAETASAALQVLGERSTDLVIMDVSLPDYSGLELLRRMRACGHNVKVIVMSGRGSVESAEEAMRLGAVAYLLKPFNFSEILTLAEAGVKACVIESILSEGSSEHLPAGRLSVQPCPSQSCPQ